MSSAVIINTIAPKYVIAKSVNSLSNPMDEFLKFKTEPIDDVSDVSSVSSHESGTTCGSRKRKLDHLTTEEKIQRKKLKNRVAAQTSRDRKKAKMEDMDSQISTQAAEIKNLTETCKTLRKEKDEMKQMYTKLEKRCVDLEKKLAEQEKELKQTKLDANIASRVIGSVTNITGSAVSNTDPLPQGMVAQSIIRNVKSNSTNQVQALLKIITLCMLYKNGSKDAMSTNLNSSPIASWATLQPKLKKMLQQHLKNQRLQAFQNPLIDPQWEPQPMSNPESIWM